MQVTPFAEGARPAAVVVEDLRASPDEKSAEKILTDLQGRRGDHLDWEAFWRELSGETSLSQKLLAQNRDSLLALQLRGCDSRGHSAFARFLLAQNSGWESLLPPRRTCQAPLGPELSVAILQKTLSQNLSLDAKEAWLSFLNKEIRDTPDSSGWSLALGDNLRRQLTDTVENLIEEKRVGETLPFLSRYARLGQRVLGGEKLRTRIFLDTSLLGYFQSRFGAVETVLLLNLLAASDESIKRSFSPIEMKATLSLLLRVPFEEIGSDVHTGWEHYLRWRQLVDSISRRWPFVERMKLLQRQQEEAEKWLRSLSATDREIFFRERRTGVPRLAEAGEIAWFRARLDPNFLEGDRASVSAQLTGLPSRLTSQVDLALNLRVRIHLQGNMAERKKTYRRVLSLLRDPGNASDGAG